MIDVYDKRYNFGILYKVGKPWTTSGNDSIKNYLDSQKYFSGGHSCDIVTYELNVKR